MSFWQHFENFWSIEQHLNTFQMRQKFSKFSICRASKTFSVSRKISPKYPHTFQTYSKYSVYLKHLINSTPLRIEPVSWKPSTFVRNNCPSTSSNLFLPYFICPEWPKQFPHHFSVIFNLVSSGTDLCKKPFACAKITELMPAGMYCCNFAVMKFQI